MRGVIPPSTEPVTDAERERDARKFDQLNTTPIHESPVSQVPSSSHLARLCITMVNITHNNGEHKVISNIIYFEPVC